MNAFDSRFFGLMGNKTIDKDSKKIVGKLPQVEQALDPSLILWSDIGAPFWKRLLIIIASSLLFVVCFICLVFA